MNLATLIDLLCDHYQRAEQLHPEPKTADQWTQHISRRLLDARDAALNTELPDAKLVAGKRCLQVAAMALRMIVQLELGQVHPDYDAHELPHTEV